MLLVVFQWTWKDLEHVDSVHSSTVSRHIRRTTVRQDVVLKPGKMNPHFLTSTAITRTISPHNGNRSLTTPSSPDPTGTISGCAS